MLDPFSSLPTTKFILNFINPGQLDRQYLLNDMIQAGNEQIIDHFSQPQDVLSKITTSLEHVGVSKSRAKPHETIILNDINVRLFVTPYSVQANPNAACGVAGSKGVNKPTKNTILTSTTPLLKTTPPEQLVHPTTGMIDLQSMKKCWCWNCRHSIPSEWNPVGIPLKYRSDNNSFECEGVFCSFNCISAYLQEHVEYRYKDSTVLLSMLYRMVFNVNRKTTDIVPAPSWKLLKTYGGHLTIDEYRKSFQTVEYRTLQQLFRKDKLHFQTASEMFVETS